MEELSPSSYENQATTLRAELKRWEGEWAMNHGGNKPTRGDIKQNTAIAQKYKLYNKLRDSLSEKPKQDDSCLRKRSSPSTAPSQSSPKRVKIFQTPSKSQHVIHDMAAAATPSLSRKLFTPTAPTSIGPTPQKDGRVLGLFDLLAGTPSRSRGDAGVADHAHMQRTPSKPSAAPTDAAVERDLLRTPLAASKRSLFGGNTTPLQTRDGCDHDNMPSITTPSSRSVSKLQFSTPAFLRRTQSMPLSAVDENGEWKVEPIRLPRKFHGRGLSRVVASLRRMEEDTLDEELDVLRELENDAVHIGREEPDMKRDDAKANGADMAVGVQTSALSNMVDSVVEVGDSQARPVLLGAFDDEALYDSPEAEQLGRDGQPLRIFKKKGQKRTTRKVNIKPMRHGRPAGPAAATDDEWVPETQAAGEACGHLSQAELEPASDDDLSDHDERERSSGTRAITAGPGTQKLGKEGVLRAAVRKVKASAHANFRRLKLRNNGAKGGPGHNSRFRRRR